MLHTLNTVTSFVIAMGLPFVISSAGVAVTVISRRGK